MEGFSIDQILDPCTANLYSPPLPTYFWCQVLQYKFMLQYDLWPCGLMSSDNRNISGSHPYLR